MDLCKETQGFGENQVSAYNGMGLKGHPGVDIVCGYGSKIEWPLVGGKAYVYKVIDSKRPANDGSGYYALFAVCEVAGEYFELAVGHCSAFAVDVGFEPKTGDVVAREGNRGLVFVNGREITLAEQNAGSIEGSHRHWQKRHVLRTNNLEEKGAYLLAYDPAGPKQFQDSEGFYYYTPMADYHNGYNGCVDCAYILDEYAKYKENPVSPLPVKPPESELTQEQEIYFLTKIKEIWQALVDFAKQKQGS